MRILKALLLVAYSASLFAGPKGDGVSNDTAALQSMLNSSLTVFVPKGTYLITCDSTPDKKWASGGLAPRSNSRIVLAPGAVIKCTPNKTGHYVVFRLKDVDHVSISGGVLDGNRDAVVAPKTEWGFGIGCFGCEYLTLENVTAENFWGDGFYLGTSPDSHKPALAIHARGLVAKNNRRNGASFVDAVQFSCRECRFQDSGGTDPQAGVDIEPGGFGTVKQWECINCEFLHNAGTGIDVDGFSGTRIEDIRIDGGRAESNGLGAKMGNNYGGAGVRISNHNADKTLIGPVEVSHMKIANNRTRANGLQIIDVQEGTVKIHDNDIIDNGDETDDQVALVNTVGVECFKNRVSSTGTPARHGFFDNSGIRTHLHDNSFCHAGKDNVSTYQTKEQDHSNNTECGSKQ